MKKIIGIGFFICMFLPFKGNSQTTAGFEQLEILKIVEMYKNAPNLSFSFTVSYADSAHADSIISSSTGSCKMSDGRYYTSAADGTEYIQGYQYGLVISPNDSTVTVYNRQEYGDMIKGIPVLDTLFFNQYVDSMKVVSYDDVPTNDLVIYFNASAPYSKYILTYDHTSYQITNIIFYMKSIDPNDSIATGRINFSLTSYSTAPISQDVFWEDKYIYKQGGTLHLKPTYSNYQLIDNTTPSQPELPQ